MWSRKGSPVATLTRPGPSRSTFARRRVSLLFRVTSALLLKAHLDGVGVRAETFHRRQPYTCLTQHLQVAAVEAQDAGSLHERVHAERRREASRARGGQRV